jgi:CDP-paratose 2-epimerase
MTFCLRGGSLTEPDHLVFGLRVGGGQARENIYSADVARFVECFIEAPRSGGLYGGRCNICPILYFVPIT